MRERVYHPDTDEPFDVPHRKAVDLRLQHGWRSTPLDPQATPAVQDTERGTGTDPGVHDFDDRDQD